MRFRLFGFLMLAMLASVGQAQSSLAERYLFQAANQERIHQGLAPLTWDPQLYAAARSHAFQMANAGAIGHQLPGEPELAQRISEAGARFAIIAENVAAASTAVLVHDGWMNSPHHRENILDPRLTSVGIAVIARGRELYAVQDFSRSVANLSLQQQEQAVVNSLLALRLNAAPSDAARANCLLDSGTTGDTHPLFIMRWTSTDLTFIPEQLKSRLRQRRYTSAEVGACLAQPSDSFTAYRIAVLMY